MSLDLPDFTYPISIVGYTITSLPITISAITIAHLDVDIVAQSVGNISVNIAASAVTLNVNLQSQSVDINIKTSGGANIIIDKLTQAAYKERRSTLSNDENPTPPNAPTSSSTGLADRGKFFPRGSRGYISKLQVYCKRTGSGTLTLGYRPAPKGGEIGSVTITPGSDWAWAEATVRVLWQYDSMFIYVKTCAADVSIGCDVAGDPDFYYIDANYEATDPYAARVHIRAVMSGETAGDLPISGTLNTIEIPAISIVQSSTTQTITAGSTFTFADIAGCGKITFMRLYDNYGYMRWTVTIDGIIWTWYGQDYFELDTLGFHDPDKRGLGVRNLVRDPTNLHWRVDIALSIPFKRSFKLECYNPHTASHNAQLTSLLGEKIS